MSKTDPGAAKQERKKATRWVVSIFLITILVSGTISLLSDILMENSSMAVAFLILLVDPVKMLIFVALILVIQQIEGNILGPKILGNLTGLPSFWVMFSTLALGGLFGVAGMVLGVPVFAILLAMLQNFSSKHLRRKGMPTATAAYLTEQDILPENPENGD